MPTLFVLLSAFVLLTGSSVLGPQCPGQDWHYRKGTRDCYYIFNPKTTGQEAFTGPRVGTLKFHETVQECQMRGGQIATFNTHDELEWIESKITTKNANFWIGLTFETLTWSWTNGNITKPYDDIGLMPRPTDPDVEDVERRKQYRGALTYDASSKEIVFRSRAGEWTNCYICKGTYSSRPWCRLDNGWVYYGGKCLKFYPHGASFATATETCETENGNIAVVRSDSDDRRMQDWLRDYVEEERSWIGITIPSKTANTTVSDVRWLDGTPIMDTPVNHWVESNLTHIIESLPNGKPYCGLLHTKDSVWNDYYYNSGEDPSEPEIHQWSFSSDCDQQLPFICEAPRGPCPYGWYEFEDDCYKFVQDTPESFQKARENCHKLKGDLVTIKSGVVQDFIQAVIGKGAECVNGRYSWIDESSLNYHAWNETLIPSELSFITGFVCGYAQRAGFVSSETGKWAVAACSQLKGYICKTPTSASIPDEPVVHPATTCEAPFFRYQDGCYLLVKEQKNRDDAQRHCLEHSSVLAYPNTFSENVWMKSKASQKHMLSYKINENFRTNYRGYLAGNSVRRFYGKLPGTSLQSLANFLWYLLLADLFQMRPGDFENFYYASSRDDKKPCIVMAGENHQVSPHPGSGVPFLGEWYYAACTEQRQFMCYHRGTPIENPDLETDHSDPFCGAGWVREGDNCYHINLNNQRWHLAKQTCQNLAFNADLLHITTKAELQFISDFLANRWPFSGHKYWLGLYADEANQWHWPPRDSNNTRHIPLAVTNFAYGEPREIAHGEGPRCTYMEAWRYSGWYATACNDERLRFVCKKTLQNGQGQSCPSGWLDYNGRCVRFVPGPRDWLAAKEDCRVSGGHLVTVRNHMELVFTSHLGVGAWTGLNAIADPGPQTSSSEWDWAPGFRLEQ
ncbi:lymphocyte antigen 75-like [Paramacrobiotus metropolitanus]|uniref:lymphocyte antigen 75-like n=1 Tax=Paramacrobiotus metropolitanus TaxID=2943436 RepID=UPI002445C573|nr:lymphocyte antigen 75-like [Paramacrobiotus metropolitanus]